MKLQVAIILAVFARNAAGVCTDEFSAEHDSSPGRFTRFLQAQNPSGTARTDYFRSSKRLDRDTDFLGATVQIKVLPSFNDVIDGKVEARLTNPALNKDGHTTSRLLEGYVTMHFAKADLRLGKQIVAWGRADGINPTDNLTPRDFTVLLPFDDDQRFGTLALKLDTYLSPEHTLTVFTTPFFEPSRIPRPASGPSIMEKIPERSLANTVFGLKLNKVGEGFDWSASYFHGFSELASLRFLGSDATGPLLELHYDRIKVLGADFARNFGRFGFRGEVAYVDTRDDSGTDPGTKNPFLFWIVGVDRTFFENMNVNLQFFQRRIRRYHNPENIDDAVERDIAIQNAIIGGQQDRISNGISFRVSNKWFNDTLEAEIFSILNTTRHDNFIRSLLRYAFSDHWKGTLGAEFYFGAAETQFGSLKPNRGGFAEARYSF